MLMKLLSLLSETLTGYIIMEERDIILSAERDTEIVYVQVLVNFLCAKMFLNMRIKVPLFLSVHDGFSTEHL